MTPGNVDGPFSSSGYQSPACLTTGSLPTGQLKSGVHVSVCPCVNARVHAWASLTADISQAPEPTPAPARPRLFMKRRVSI